MPVQTVDLQAAQRFRVVPAVGRDGERRDPAPSDLPAVHRVGFPSAPPLNRGVALPATGQRFGVQLVAAEPAAEQGLFDESALVAREVRQQREAEAAAITTFQENWTAAVAAGREQELLAGLRLGVGAPPIQGNPSQADLTWERAAGLVRLGDLPDLDPRVRVRLAELGRELLQDVALATTLRQDFEGPLTRQFGEGTYGSEPDWKKTAVQLVAMADTLRITPRSEVEQVTLGYSMLLLSHGVGDPMGVGADTLKRFGADPKKGAWGLQKRLLERMRALPIVQNATADSDGARLAKTIDVFTSSRNGGWQSVSEPAFIERFSAGSLDGRDPVDRAAIDRLVKQAGDALENGLLDMTQEQRARVFAHVWSLGVNLGALTDGANPKGYFGNSWLRSDWQGEPVVPTDATFDAAHPEAAIAALRTELEARARRRLDTIERAPSRAGRNLAYVELQVVWPQFVRGPERMFRREQAFQPLRANEVIHRAVATRAGRAEEVR